MKPDYLLRFLACAVLTAGIASCSDDKNDEPGPGPGPGTNPGTEAVEFAAVSSTIDVTPEGLFHIGLTAASGDEIFLQAVPSPEYVGTYAVSSGTAPGTITGAAAGSSEGVSWYRAAGGQDKLWISEGSADVTAEISETAVILGVKGTLKTLDGTEIALSASGITIPLAPEPLRFTAVSGECTVNGNLLDMDFTGEDGAKMFVSLDISSGLSGTFPVSPVGTPGAIAGAADGITEGASRYTAPDGGEPLYFVSGEAEIAFADGDLLVVTLNGRFTLSDGSVLNAAAESVTLAEMEMLPMTIGELMYYGPNDNGTGLFFLYLKDGEAGSMTHNMGLYVNTEPVADVANLFLPAGQYVRNTGDTPAYSLNAAEGQTHYNCFWWSTQPELEQFMATDAGMTVSRSGDIYTIEGFMMTAPHKGITFTFTGRLPAEDYS